MSEVYIRSQNRERLIILNNFNSVKYNETCSINKRCKEQASRHTICVSGGCLDEKKRKGTGKLKYDARHTEKQAIKYARLYACNFCKGNRLHSCTGYDCGEPQRRAYEYSEQFYRDGRQP